jgi:type II secretory pathway pseudopilin PulG
MTTDSRDPQSGFSMVELTVAMLITIIISGAIYALIVSGSNSFRREPALSDRQQNARIALDMVSRDVLSAGQGTPPKLAWIQLFKRGLNGQGPNVAAAMPNGVRSDYLQLIGNDGSCPDLAVCDMGGVSMTTQVAVPGCYGLPGLVLAWDNDGHSSVLFGCSPGKGVTGGDKKCEGVGSDNDNRNGHVVFPTGKDSMNPPGGKLTDPYPCPAGETCEEWGPPTGISPVVLVRYELRVDADNVPNLWRSPFGGEDLTGMDDGKCQGGDGELGTGWEMVARGIEDFQVRYMSQAEYAGSQTWADEPPDTEEDDWGSLVRQVEITMDARTVGQAQLTGESTKNTVTAVRGRLQTVITPRSSLAKLAVASPDPLYR